METVVLIFWDQFSDKRNTINNSWQLTRVVQSRRSESGSCSPFILVPSVHQTKNREPATLLSTARAPKPAFEYLPLYLFTDVTGTKLLMIPNLQYTKH